MPIEGTCEVCGSTTSDYNCLNCIISERDALKTKVRGFKVMAHEMFIGIDPGFWRSAIADGKYERAGGEVECRACGIGYLDHPQLPGLPTFHMICSGEIVKT